jgi:hypothetical protein
MELEGIPAPAIPMKGHMRMPLGWIPFGLVIWIANRADPSILFGVEDKDLLEGSTERQVLRCDGQQE